MIMYAQPVTQALEKEISALSSALSHAPTLAIIRLGDDGANVAYERGATKKIRDFGFNVKHYMLRKDTSEENLLGLVQKLGEEKGISGILVMQPLPPQIDPMAVRKAIDPRKDVDCMSLENLGLLLAGSPRHAPCTPEAVMSLLNHYEVTLEGQKIAIIGSSLVVGKPLSVMLSAKRATVTLCNSLTPNLAQVAWDSDIVISATGSPHFITKEFVHSEQILVDVGTTVVDGKLQGDIQPEVYDLVKAYTPTPKGIGGITTTILARNLVRAELIN